MYDFDTDVIPPGAHAIALPEQLKDEWSGTVIVADATVTATLYDAAGVAVPGAVDMPCAYWAGAPNPGTCRVKVPVAAETPAGSGYRARVKAVTQDGTTFLWTQKVRVGDVEV